MNLFETVKNNVTATDVVSMAGYKPNRSKMMCCPFHNDKHPSMKVDQRYFCFACRAKGDAIDFVANYYGLSLKEAAEKIASVFSLSYDNMRYFDCVQKAVVSKRNEYQIWAEKKRELFAQLSRLHEIFQKMKIEYAPKDREDSNWNPLFVLAETEFTYVDYLYDYCMFEAAEEELKQKYEEITKEMERIEKRIYDTKSGIRGSDAGQAFKQFCSFNYN